MGVATYKRFFNFGIKVSSDTIKKASLVLIFLNLYVLCHVLFGNNSVIDYFKIKKQIIQKEQSLHVLLSQNKEYEKEIAMLQPNNLDKDYLEELVRSQLNYSYPDEKVIVYSDNVKR